jgi:hypothetical protein
VILSDHCQSLVDKLTINGELVTWINHEDYSAFIPKEMHQSTLSTWLMGSLQVPSLVVGGSLN